MPNIRLTLEYDGREFCGFQSQKNATSVQQELDATLRKVLGCSIGPIHGSGRTDSGVHARGQVVSFSVDTLPDLRRLQIGVSSLLRGRLAVVDAAVVPDDFHARASAISKQYSYLILNRLASPALQRGKVWHVPELLDFARMQQEAQSFLGVHDFTSVRALSCAARSAEREIQECELTLNGDLIQFRVVGNGFLRNMVRIMVGTLVWIGKGRITDSVATILAARNREFAGKTAPAEGLYLDWVKYRGSGTRRSKRE